MFERCLVFALLICGAAIAQNTTPSPAEVWKQHSDKGRALEASGHYSEAKEQFQAALRVAAGVPKDARNFLSQIELATITAAMGQYMEAEHWDNDAVRLGVELFGKDSPELAAPFNNLATLYRDQGDYVRAEEFCRRALHLIAEPAVGPPAPRAQVLGTLGGILYYRGKLAEAEATLRQSLQIAETLPQPSDILPGVLNNLANVYAKTGRPASALATFQKAYALFQKGGNENDPSLFFVLAGMASVQADSGHYTEAVATLESGIRLAEIGGASNTMLMRDALTAEAAWLHRLKREEEAKRVRAKAKEIAKTAARNSYRQYTLDAKEVAQAMRKPAE